MDSSEEDFYDDDGDWSEGSVDNEDPDYSPAIQHYKVLKQEDIKQLIEDDISTVSGVLSVARGVACTLLSQNNWSLTSVYENWFSDEAAAAANPHESGKKKFICKICYEKRNARKRVSTTCGHPFCRRCWVKYIATAINDGVGCLTLRCPEPGCKAAVGLDKVEGLTSADDREKYYKYLHQSYVERCRSRKWCPAPGCELAIEFDDVLTSQSDDVSCDCSHKFCWRCAEESHRPVACKTVADWLEKNRSEAENTTWILAYTKPCPKCSRAIEKNNGCNHMTCGAPCNFEFCWVCLAAWKRHGGGFYQCNKFVEEEKEKSERSRGNAKKYIERYTHYYERWNANDRSRKIAVRDLKRERSRTCNERVVIEAWEQIVECRRVLKWSYAYGFYLSMEEKNSVKLRLFECLQGQAEASLERVHHCVEKEMQELILQIVQDHHHDPDQDQHMIHIKNCEAYKEFLSNLANLTSVARNYFLNLVRALENNLSEVEVEVECNDLDEKIVPNKKKQVEEEDNDDDQ